MRKYAFLSDAKMCHSLLTNKFLEIFLQGNITKNKQDALLIQRYDNLFEIIRVVLVDHIKNGKSKDSPLLSGSSGE